MEIKNYFAQDAQGNIMPSANCYLYLPGTTTLATGLIDGNGVPISNPFLASSIGQVTFGAPNGVYDLMISQGSRNTTIEIQCADLLQALNETASFLGAKSSAPTARNDGSALQIADRYFNTSDQLEYLYKSTGWVANNLDGQLLATSRGASLLGALMQDGSPGTIQEAIDEGDNSLRQDLAQGTTPVAVDKLNPRNLSHYAGTDYQRLTALLNFAKASGEPVRIDVDITLSAVVDIDFSGARLSLDCKGVYINSDITCIKLRNLAFGSKIIEPNLRNITAPWTITRWDANGNWLANTRAALAATLLQTNDPGRYMPTSNDTALWSSLTAAQQNQTISAKLEVYSSTGVTLEKPKGRYALYEFLECQKCKVNVPDIEAGGKGVLGTIVFNNIGSTGYGRGNVVQGGRVQYGSFSGVAFLRNHTNSGVRGGFIPYRTGESGVKTFQNQISGRSARCYNMLFDGIYPEQTVYDGVDFNSDFGTAAERVDDYTLAEYPWHRLPTGHTIRNVYSKGSRTTGVWGDGDSNTYSSVGASDCLLSGIKYVGGNSEFSDPVAINNNRSLTASGEHQINIALANKVIDAYVKTDASITAGNALYLPTGEATNPILDSARPSTVLSYGDRTVKSLTMGGTDSAETTNLISFHPRLGILANDIAEIISTLTSGVNGSESGRLELKTRLTGALVHGLRLLPNDGGIAVMAMAGSIASTSSLINNSEIFFRQNGAAIELVAKLDNGSVKSVVIAP